jgi:hypothetical protein
MYNLKYLEFQRIIKELQFVESDYLYQSEVIKESDKLFLNSVNVILDKYPDIKKVWDNKNISEKTLQKIENISKNIEIDEIVNKPIHSSETKKIYREIVKSTHPDIIKNTKLNELYLESTVAYESNDLITLYKVCSELMIDFSWSDNEILKIKERIEKYKNQINFIESTYTFKWLKCDNDIDKLKIILNFIENKIK